MASGAATQRSCGERSTRNKSVRTSRQAAPHESFVNHPKLLSNCKGPQIDRPPKGLTTTCTTYHGQRSRFDPISRTLGNLWSSLFPNVQGGWRNRHRASLAMTRYRDRNPGSPPIFFPPFFGNFIHFRVGAMDGSIQALVSSSHGLIEACSYHRLHTSIQALV